jgi:hypothetical protein
MTFYIPNITKGQHNILKACFRFDWPAHEYHTLMHTFVLLPITTPEIICGLEHIIIC